MVQWAKHKGFVMPFIPQPLNQEDYTMEIVKDLGNIPGPSGRKARYALVKCTKCGTSFKMRMGSTKAKSSTQCSTCAFTRHGTSSHPLYAIWNGIKQRCYSPTRKDYAHYGGQGVTMCLEWKNSPENFITWCETNGWSKELVVDKDIKSAQLGLQPAIYSPETISFITPQQNCEAANAKTVLQYILTGELLQEFPSTVKAALFLGKSKSAKSSIANCCRGVTKSSFGYKWKYK